MGERDGGGSSKQVDRQVEEEAAANKQNHTTNKTQFLRQNPPIFPPFPWSTSSFPYLKTLILGLKMVKLCCVCAYSRPEHSTQKFNRKIGCVFFNDKISRLHRWFEHPPMRQVRQRPPFLSWSPPIRADNLHNFLDLSLRSFYRPCFLGPQEVGLNAVEAIERG